MKCQKLRTLAIVGILMAVTLSGCSSDRVSLADRAIVSVEKQDSERVKILWTDVYEQNSKTWAYGVLTQKALNSTAIKTHVDIQVLNPDGSIQYETITDDLFVPPNRIGRGPDWKKFKVKLQDQLSNDSKIRMTVHSGSHNKIDEKSIQ